MMQFQQVEGHQFHRIEFELVGASDDIYGYLGLDPSDTTYQAMQPWAKMEQGLSVDAVLESVPSESLQQSHRQNQRPVGLGVSFES